jgi:hypothetical protein
MAVSPELELRMDRLRDLNTKICNIYSEMVANSRKYMDEIFKFNATSSVRAKREAVSVARKCFEANERLKIEMERAQKEARALSDSVAKLVIEEQKDFIDQLFNCDVTGGRNKHGKDN